mgnify:CR=1 FL=1
MEENSEPIKNRETRKADNYRRLKLRMFDYLEEEDQDQTKRDPLIMIKSKKIHT